MIAAALLLLALSPVEGQGGPVVEKSGLFEYTRPEGWTRQPIGDGSFRLSPPGGGTTILRFLNPEGGVGTPEEIHLGMLRRLKLDSDILQGGVPERFGAFLRSESLLGRGKTPQLWIRLYTARVDKLWQGVFYAGVTSDGFARHSAGADVIVRSIVLPGSRERVGGIDFALPAGWKRKQEPDGATVVLLPPGIPEGHSATLSLLPARATEQTLEEHHELMWRVLTEGAVVLGRLERAERGVFRSTRVQLRNRAGERGWLALYTARRGASMETLVFAATAPEFWERHGPQADGLVAGIVFVETPVVAAPVAPERVVPKPRPIPEGDRDVKLAGIWVVSRLEKRFALEGTGFAAAERRELFLLALWENGIAFKGNVTNPILSSAGGIREGLAAVDAAALAGMAAFPDRRFARWSGTSDGVVLEGHERGPMALTRDGGNLKGPGEDVWIPLAPLEGLRLDARFVSPREGRSELSISFRADGTFGATNFDRLANEGVPAAGKGSYEFRKGSLILRFEGMDPQALELIADPSAPADSKGLLIAGTTFERR